MLSNLPASLSKINIPDLNGIAIESGFIVRESAKFCASAFVQTVVSAAATGRASYNQLADGLGRRTGNPMSRQGMQDRVTNDASVRFMTEVHDKVLEVQFEQVETPLKNSSIKRVVGEDASAITMPKSNADTFPAHGNHHGSTAGAKVDFSYDVAGGKVHAHTLHQATEQDKTIGKEAIIRLSPGDLSLRDMGYFCLSEFTYIESVGAHWLTRLPANVTVNLKNGTCLEKHLKNFKGNSIDIKVNAGDQGKSCRLVAIRADQKVADKRRRERNEKAKKKGKTPSEKSLIRDGWHIMLTDLSSEEFSAKDLAEIYRIRWGVEIQFRAWKQSMNLGAALNRKSDENHMMLVMIGAMIAHLLGMLAAQIFAKEIGLDRLSYEKLFDLLADHHTSAMCVEDICEFNPDERHISREKRSRQNPYAKGFAALA